MDRNDDIYRALTARFIEKLREGTVPWHKPWTVLPPQNLFSHRPYRGINVWVLSLGEFDSPFWGTFKQVRDHGGHIRKGEHGTGIVFWKWLKKRVEGESAEASEIEFAILRTFTVFNHSQMERIAAPVIEERIYKPIEECEQLVRNLPNPPKIVHGGTQAYYQPSADLVNLPPVDVFRNPESYWATAFHELTHASGHPSRLNRLSPGQSLPFGHDAYSREELVAELGSSFLCCETGIETPELFDNSASYLAGWLDALQSDERLLIFAAQQAQKATDYLLNRRAEETSD